MLVGCKMLFLFWLSLGLLLYIYIGYPVLLFCLTRIWCNKTGKASVLPSVSIVISAHNEEAGIRRKLENTLALDYPKDLCEIVLVSDGSTDRTAEIAVEFEEHGVQCLVLSEWEGKAVALNCALELAQGEIIAFTDVAALAEPDCIRKLVANFADPRVGCVSAEMQVVAQGSGGSEGTYIRYLMTLRRLEGQIGSCTCVCGPLYAARKVLCPEFPAHMATDLVSALEAVRCGFKVVSEPAARMSVGSVATQREEFRRKARTVMLGVECLPKMMELLNPFRYGVFSLELISHKLLRWAGGVFMAFLLISSIVLYGSSEVYGLALVAQLAVYSLALAGGLSERLASRCSAVRISSFVVYSHAAALLACWNYLWGKHTCTWHPSIHQVPEEYEPSADSLSFSGRRDC